MWRSYNLEEIKTDHPAHPFRLVRMPEHIAFPIRMHIHVSLYIYIHVDAVQITAICIGMRAGEGRIAALRIGMRATVDGAPAG